MLRDRSGGHSAGRGGVGGHLNSPVCVVISMFTGVFRRRTYCAAANGTRLSTNRPAHGMNSMSSDWGTSGGPPVSSNSGQPPPEQDDGPTMTARYGPNRCLRQPVRFRRSSWPHRCRKLAALTDDYSELAQLERVN